MKAAPESRLNLFGRAPSFLVIRGRVRWSQGGMDGILEIGKSLSYKKHGSFSVEYVGDSYAIIHHVTLDGRVKKVFIPPQKRLYLSNGFFQFIDVNYQSFLDFTAEDGSRIPIRVQAVS